MNSNLQIMDVTLRDGSYAINFQFSEADTKNLCEKLSGANIGYIEIGHGVGLGASSLKNGEALCTDEEYLKAALSSKCKAKYGMFCIPGTAKLEDLDKLKEYGASFVRIGTNVNEVVKSEPYIKKAKMLGLEVMANYMKSYASTEKEFENNVRLSKDYGADVIYIVDSAGGMSQKMIENYYSIIKRVGELKIGFHGHDNLGMAVSNSLYAAELGIDYIDTSLRGMGRSAGNASTELVCANLIKWHHFEKYNCEELVKCGEMYIKPLYNMLNHNALDIYCGLADFHSSYMQYIHKYSAKYQVNPLKLIVEYSKHDKINMNEEILTKIAAGLPKDDTEVTYGFNNYFGNEQR